jgi:HlyD family secretion protein
MKPSRFRGFLAFILLTAATLAAAAWMAIYVIKPAYEDPSNRTYESRYGYPALLRMRHKPFPVTTAVVEERTLTGHILGEGLVSAEPVIVPIIYPGRISRVYAKEGDSVKKGQLLAELDTALAEMQIARTKVALEKAKVELERTKIGSPVVMPKERPDVDELNMKVAQQEEDILRKLVALYEGLLQKGAISTEVVLKAKQDLAQMSGQVRTAQLDLNMSRPGRPLSIKAAQLVVDETQLTLDRELQEIKDYKIYAIDDGVVDHLLVHDGEYNHGNGAPAFSLAVGRWFQAHIDQTAIGRFQEGTPVDVRLEAYPGRVFSGRVEKIKPIVTYNQGGPEANRPIRPLGTGSPEWPATFEAKIVLEGKLPDIVPGLSGFAEVRMEHHGAAVPSGSLASVSAGKGIAYVVDGDGFKTQPVVLGMEADGWTEILSGLSPGTEIIATGHEVLEPGDKIAIFNSNPKPIEHKASEPVDLTATRLTEPVQE